MVSGLWQTRREQPEVHSGQQRKRHAKRGSSSLFAFDVDGCAMQHRNLFDDRQAQPRALFACRSCAPERTITAHGVDPALLGVDIDALRDVDGTAFATEMVRVAQASTQGGRSEYKWRNPATGRVERKISVVRAVGTEVCGVGAYQGD